MKEPDLPRASSTSPESVVAPEQPDTPTNIDSEKKDAVSTRSKTMRRFLKWGVFGASFLFVMSFGAVAGRYLSQPIIRNAFMKFWSNPGITVNKGGIHFDPTASYNISNFPPDKHKELTVLIMGIDHDYGGKRLPDGSAIPTIEHTTQGRSDALMLARFELEEGQVTAVKVLSIPRDLRVMVPGNGLHKINAAHAYGGADLSVATVRELFGVNPDYYVELNFESFQQVVDAIGGVDVNIHQELDYDDNWGNLHIHLKPGLQHLNGYKAMGYVRIRHSDSDLMRAQRQHEFLEALRGQVASPKTLLQLPAVVSAISDNLKSNMTTDQMITLANLTRKAPKDSLHLETLPVLDGKTFLYLNRRKAAAMVRKMFFHDAQVADMTLASPDAQTERPRHRRRRHTIRESQSGGSNFETTPGDNGSQKPDAIEQSPSGSEAAPAKSDNGSSASPQKVAPPDNSKPDNNTGSDSGKTPSGKDSSSGTSSAGTSTIRI